VSLLKLSRKNPRQVCCVNVNTVDGGCVTEVCVVKCAVRVRGPYSNTRLVYITRAKLLSAMERAQFGAATPLGIATLYV
jgi:hypothetical protein